MRLLESTFKYETHTEEEAKDAIETFRQKASENGYMIKKASYEYKSKKSKGEIIGEAWVVTVVETFGTLWEDL